MDRMRRVPLKLTTKSIMREAKAPESANYSNTNSSSAMTATSSSILHKFKVRFGALLLIAPAADSQDISSSCGVSMPDEEPSDGP